MYNVNIMVIYFLLCCVYGNFTHKYGMKFYFLSKVLKCIALYHYHCGIVFFFSHILKFPFPERTGFLFEEECWRSGEFSMDYFTMFAVCASYCVFTSPLARESSVCSVALPHPEPYDRATQRILTVYIWIEAHYVFWEHRTPPSAHTKPWSLRGTNRHQFWL